MARNSGTSFIGRFFFLIFLFTIIFIAVYGALHYKDKKEKEVQKLKKIKTQELLITEFIKNESFINEVNNIDTAIDSFFRKYKSFMMPLISDYNFLFAYSETDNFVCKALLNSFYDLNNEVSANIIQYMNTKNKIAKTLNKGYDFQKTLIIPNFDKGIYEFYNFRTKQLKPKYALFPKYMKILQGEIKQFKVKHNSLKNTLSKNLEKIRKKEN